MSKKCSFYKITFFTLICKASPIDFLNQCQISFRMRGHFIGFTENLLKMMIQQKKSNMAAKLAILKKGK